MRFHLRRFRNPEKSRGIPPALSQLQHQLGYLPSCSEVEVWVAPWRKEVEAAIRAGDQERAEAIIEHVRSQFGQEISCQLEVLLASAQNPGQVEHSSTDPS